MDNSGTGANKTSSKTGGAKNLRAGPTNRENKVTRNQYTGSNKTATTNDKEAEIIKIGGKVVTPKRLMTLQLDAIQSQVFSEQSEYWKDVSQQKEKSVVNSAEDSAQRGSSQNLSSVVSQSKSETSESDSKKDTELGDKKKKEKQQDMEGQVSIILRQTSTNIFMFIPSSLCLLDSPDIQRNKHYKSYVQQRIGSDNYVKRPIQTFNFQPKVAYPQVEKTPTADKECQAAFYDILDSFKVDQKTECQLLQEQIKKSTEKRLGAICSNPFSMLFTDNQAISIHTRAQVPGASESISIKDTRSKNINITQNVNASSGKDDSKKPRLKGQIQKEIQQSAQTSQKNEKQMYGQVLQKMKKEPSLAEKRVIQNQNLLTSLKYVDRILNNITFHKQYILYRNYPQVKVQKIFADQQQNRRKRNVVQQKQEQQTKFQHLQYLFKFSCEKTQGNTVSSADWNPINKDLLAVAYGDLNLTSQKEGLLAFWTLKNPSFPERIIQSQSRITSCKFSNDNPNLIACGTYDGVVAIYDIRKKEARPVAQNRQLSGKHSDVVWEVQWISKGKSNDKGESLVSISSDARITQWSMKKGLQFNDLMTLKRQTPTSKKDSTESMNFRQASGLSFDFLKGETSMYLASTQEGTIHRCSKSYAEQYLDTYFGHTGPVYRVRCNPFFSDIFLTCSADWTCKLWNWRKDQPQNTFHSLQLHDQVTDIEWSPYCSTLFCTVCKDGRIELWDLTKKNMLDPICIISQDKEGNPLPSKTMVRFSKGAPVVVTGDIAGDVAVYRLHDYEDNNPVVQRDRLVKLLYPAGYNKGNLTEEANTQQRTE